MQPLSLTTKRVLAGIYVAVLCLCAGSYYLGWGLFGAFDKKALAVVVFLGVILSHRYGASLLAEVRAYRARERERTGGNA